MKKIKKNFESIYIFLLLIFFVVILLSLWVLYDEITLNTVILVLGSLFGIAMGSFLTGRHAFNTFKNQVVLKELDEQRQIEIKQEKYNIYLSIHLNIILNNVRSIEYFMNLEIGHNNYNVNPTEEIKKSINEIKEVIKQLFQIDPSYISKDNYRLLGKIYSIKSDIENSFNGYLATEEEESIMLSKNVIKKSQNLIKLIGE
ncbi:hypothetical protein [Virgibacillus halodenitrificans]|uniref:Uncharacterized protein n=1 Tax=Virgibacillus halodenitrificans TaxID=1482 RepID=A0ABR7VMZ3_VIRHA|nr:hypothetical protein [Virgibacillus halodenitrificans]MBD1223275.1 hypothetical protein [Virgibacillus halodenitrificans]